MRLAARTALAVLVAGATVLAGYALNDGAHPSLFVVPQAASELQLSPSIDHANVAGIDVPLFGDAVKRNNRFRH